MFKISIKLSLVLLSLLTVFSLYAQNGKIKFEKNTHNFGVIKEEAKKVSYKFVFTNVGTDALKITRVKPGCGCTSSDHTKNLIQPGAQGFVQATYHTTNRPGAFRKSINVTTDDADQPNSVLFIKGKVTKKAKSIGDKYPTAMGHLKVMRKNVSFGEIKMGKTKTDTVKIYNNWNKEMTFKFEQIAEYLDVHAVPAKLKPHQEGIIIIKYDASKNNDFGATNYNFGIRTNDNTQIMKSMGVTANIRQDFSELSPKDLKKAPKIVFENTTHDFETLQRGTVVKHSFTFKNAGKKDLRILKVKTSCGCTGTETSSTTVKKRKSGTIDVKFDTKGRLGNQHKTITVITNDPTNPIIHLHIKGNLTK